MLGLLAVVFYGGLAVTAAFPVGHLKRWSARLVIVDSPFIVASAFFALILISPVPWWAAALLAAVLVPLALR